MNKQITSKNSRKKRIRQAIRSKSNFLRLSIFRSNKNIFVQIIDDQKSKTLVSASSLKLKHLKGNNVRNAEEIGKLIALKALEKDIKSVVFDRGAYKYHGVVKALADKAREAGLKF